MVKKNSIYRDSLATDHISIPIFFFLIISATIWTMSLRGCHWLFLGKTTLDLDIPNDRPATSSVR